MKIPRDIGATDLIRALRVLGHRIALEWPAYLLVMGESSGRAMARNLNQDHLHAGRATDSETKRFSDQASCL